MRGWALRSVNRLDAAIEDFDNALRLNARNLDALCGRSMCRLDLGHLDEALVDCDAALEIDQKSAELYGHRGDILTTLGRLDEALVACTRAVELKPDWGIGHAAHGDTLWNAGRQAEAIEAYSRALELVSEKREYAIVSGTLATIAKYQTALVNEFNSKLKGVGESNSPVYTDEIADTSGDVGDFAAKNGFKTVGELQEFIDNWKAADAEITPRETTARATVPPRLDDDTRPELPPLAVAEIVKEPARRDWVETPKPRGKTANVLATFIREKFAEELADGTMTTQKLYRYEALHDAFYNHKDKLPRDLQDMPTRSELNDRMVAEGKVRPEPPRSEYYTQRSRVQRARQRRMG
jgi:tetratricopeptide (TPR) repeat protein